MIHGKQTDLDKLMLSKAIAVVVRFVVSVVTPESNVTKLKHHRSILDSSS